VVVEKSGLIVTRTKYTQFSDLHSQKKQPREVWNQEDN